mmetsp:Transcript_44082/g.95038  ORF Transcript_44082/g.95038 Transcript_44082/m.95038 type:complete len:191 (-) Transcript_44082:195-767(-)
MEKENRSTFAYAIWLTRTRLVVQAAPHSALCSHGSKRSMNPYYETVVVSAHDSTQKEGTTQNFHFAMTKTEPRRPLGTAANCIFMCSHTARASVTFRQGTSAGLEMKTHRTNSDLCSGETKLHYHMLQEPLADNVLKKPKMSQVLIATKAASKRQLAIVLAGLTQALLFVVLLSLGMSREQQDRRRGGTE